MILKCLIVDDEPLAIKLLAGYVERTPFLRLVGSCLDPVEALEAITPDVHLLFLDIQMPGLTGLELSRLVQPPTRIIFTTAYKDYAFDSYQVQALHYLLKPVSYPAFLEAANRAREHFASTEVTAPCASTAVSEVRSSLSASTGGYLFVKCEYRLVRVDLDDILFISGLKDYVRIFLKDRPRALIALTTLKGLEEKLPPQRFLRVHRSYIVALDKIESLEHNRLAIGDELIPVADTCLEELMRRINP